MKRKLCLLLVLILMLSLGAPAFADDVLYCIKCGKQLPPDSNFCPYCGAEAVHADGTTAVKSGASSSPVAGPFSVAPSSSGTANGVRVTKNPTSESVPYGGSCIFIAHADHATTVTWYMANRDASVITKASEAPNSVSGLYVSGANSDTLSLSGIPSWMNGFRVQACFEGEGGPVYTQEAVIWTYEETKESDTLWWWNWWKNPHFHPGFWPFVPPCPGPDPGPGPGPGPCPEPGPGPGPGPCPEPGPGPGPGPCPEPGPGPGPGPCPGPGEPTNVSQIGHESLLDPSSSWWDPHGRPIPQNGFDPNNGEHATANPDFTPIAESGGGGTSLPSGRGPGPGQKPGPGKPSDVSQIGHESLPDPSSSGRDSHRGPIPQDGFDPNNGEHATANPDFAPIAESGGNTGGTGLPSGHGPVSGPNSNPDQNSFPTQGQVSNPGQSFIPFPSDDSDPWQRRKPFPFFGADGEKLE